MKKLLILIVASALYFNFYPNEKLNHWLFEQKNRVLSKFSALTDTKIRLKVEKISEDLHPYFNQFSRQEKIYLAEITASRQNVKSFYTQYCRSNKQATRLHRDNVRIVCQVISKYSNLL